MKVLAMVKCSDCGMLAVNNGAGAVVIAPPLTRQHGEFTSGSGGLCCAADACSHIDEFQAYKQPEKPDSQKWLHVVSQPRSCCKFLAWRKGLDLTEHWEIGRMLELEKMNEERRTRDLAFQAEQKESERRWQETQKIEDRSFQSTQLEKQMQRETRNLFVGAFLTVIGGLIGGLISTYFGLGQNPTPSQPVISSATKESIQDTKRD